MRVVIIPHGFQEHYALSFANGLAASGVSVDFARAANMDSALLHRDIRSKNLGRNIDNRIGAYQKAYRYVAYHARLIAYVSARWGSVVHVIGLLRTPIVTGIIEGLLFRVLGSRYVLTVHNLLPHDEHTGWNRWLFRIAYRIPHLLVVHTARMKSELAESFGISRSRIVVMQHGLNDIVPDHGRTSEECRTQLGLPSNACVLLFFGRIAPYKGLETLLDAFRNTGPDVFLVVAGAPINIAYGHHIEKLMSDHPWHDRILSNLQFIDNAEIATYFRAADALVMPYRHIDQSGVLFLALRFAVPIIAFDVGAMNEYIQSDTGVLVRGESAQDLTDGIMTLRSDRQRFQHDAVKHYTDRFRWERVLIPLIEAYQKC